MSAEISINKMENHACLLMGSNIEPEKNIRAAYSLLSPQVAVLRQSQIWENPPIGSPGPNFFNLALEVETQLSASELKWNLLRKIENALGRRRSIDKYAPRTIDLDIILFNGEVVDEKLWSCGFILVPVSDLFPDLEEPSSGLTLSQLRLKWLEGGDFICRELSIQG